MTSQAISEAAKAEAWDAGYDACAQDQARTFRSTPNPHKTTHEAAAPHMLAGNAAVPSELKFLRGERKSLLRHIASWEAQGHSTMGLDFLKRHLAKKQTSAGGKA